MGFFGAVAGSAAGALLSSTRGGTRPREHAIWMAFGAAMGIEGRMPSIFHACYMVPTHVVIAIACLGR